jgi:hypothetical protein
MTNLNIVATSRTPKITFKTKAGTLLIEGESYPEDVTGFYDPVFAAVNDYLKSPDAKLDVDIKLIYFNSSSARAYGTSGYVGCCRRRRCQGIDQMVLRW